MTKIPTKYRGQWVAVTLPETKVISSGNTPKEALDGAKGISNVAVTKIPKKPGYYLFTQHGGLHLDPLFLE